ncbi:Dcp1-like decapping family protein [Bisporella sp. PMI_857]|nr:Dcp1-like decapping family protein [Bisporella sp. PMI_857]
MTPARGRRHAKNKSQSNLPVQIQPSDYESEAPYAAPPTRTNTEMNLSVLRRYEPSISTVMSIAASAVIYNFSLTEQTWEKADIEGTLFVCKLQPVGNSRIERYGIVVLNKKSFENLMVDMSEVTDVEITPELLIVRLAQVVGERILGIYIHADKEQTREENCRLIKECWESVHEQENTKEGSQYGADVFEDSEAQHVGKTISVNQLFGR